MFSSREAIFFGVASVFFIATLTGCSPGCDSHADCDDGHRCTKDACVWQGVVGNWRCEHVWSCDDDDPCTNDQCGYSNFEWWCFNLPVDCGDLVCDPDSGACVECVVDTDCSEGEGCVFGECLPPIGACDYHDISGTATIVSVDGGVDLCDLVTILFEWAPDDPDDPLMDAYDAGFVQYAYEEGIPLEYRCGDTTCKPAREWVDNEGLTVGSQHPCNVSVDLAGPCPPLIYEFQDVDYATAAGNCPP